MIRPPNYPRIRYRRLGGGYNRNDVNYSLRELEDTVRRLEEQLAESRASERDTEAELRFTQTELAAFRARETQITEAYAAAQRRAGEVEGAAEARSLMILAQAEEQAAKIRGDAYLKIEETAGQLEEILKLKGTLAESVRGVLTEVEQLLGRIERGERTVIEPDVEDDGPPQSPTVSVPRAAAEPGGPLFEQRVELDAGPFADFAALSTFERALGRLPSVQDVYVRRFAGEEATIELTLGEEIDLVAALRDVLPYEFDVERADSRSARLRVPSASPLGTR
jgi:cell division septum initiation protein DivIVA